MNNDSMLSKQNLLGIFFLCLSFISGICAVYLIQTKLNKVPETIEINTRKTVHKIKENKNVELLGKLKASKTLLSKESKQERQINQEEGVLWIDQNSRQFVVTLGAKHGLMPGEVLSIYKNKEKAFDVEVATVLDDISFVDPIKKETDSPISLDSNYYRVVLN